MLLADANWHPICGGFKGRCIARAQEASELVGELVSGILAAVQDEIAYFNDLGAWTADPIQRQFEWLSDRVAKQNEAQLDHLERVTEQETRLKAAAQVAQIQRKRRLMRTAALATQTNAVQQMWRDWQATEQSLLARLATAEEGLRDATEREQVSSRMLEASTAKADRKALEREREARGKRTELEVLQKRERELERAHTASLREEADLNEELQQHTRRVEILEALQQKHKAELVEKQRRAHGGGMGWVCRHRSLYDTHCIYMAYGILQEGCVCITGNALLHGGSWQ